MSVSAKSCNRVLAIDPSKRGFGFAVLEEPEELIDWGLRGARQEKNTDCLRQIITLIEKYCPDVIVIEDWQSKDSLRRARIRDLLEDTVKLALSKKLTLRKISRSAIRKAFSQYNASNKWQIAVEIGKRFPELAVCVPPTRKPWMTEDARMRVFGAVALVLASFQP